MEHMRGRGPCVQPLARVRRVASRANVTVNYALSNAVAITAPRRRVYTAVSARTHTHTRARVDASLMEINNVTAV